jgi:hypothetical protein
VQIGNQDYLVPIDAELAREVDVDDETVALDRAIRRFPERANYASASSTPAAKAPSLPGQARLKPGGDSGKHGLTIRSPKIRRAPNKCRMSIFVVRPGPLE